MKVKKQPFNISILNTNSPALKQLGRVKVTDIWDTTTGELHPDGLYSNTTFGIKGSRDRNMRHGIIDLNTTVFHPKILQEIFLLKGFYKGILEGREFGVWDDKAKDIVKSNILEGQTGFSFFVECFKKIKFKRNKSVKRDLRIDLIEKFRDVVLMDKLVVLPAGIRELEGEITDRPTEHDINKLYRGVVNSNYSISAQFKGKENSVIDTPRWQIQRNVVDIFNMLEDMLSGKTGIVQSKYAARRITGSTRNTISSMDVSAPRLDDVTLPGIDTTQVGLHQYMKGCMPLVRYRLREGIAKDMIDNINGEVELVDVKTMTPVMSRLSQRQADKWSTDDGIESLINGYNQQLSRHKPVMVDGKYLSLIYRDDKHFKTLKDINDLPEKFDKSKVRGLTWAELFYITMAPVVSSTYAFVTRFPINSMNSIYHCKLHLRTTIVSSQLTQLGDDWQDTGTLYPCMPIEGASIDTLIPHPSNLVLIGGDYDGDQCALSIIYSQEGTEEVRKKLETTSDYLDTAGNFKYSYTDDTVEFIFNNFY